MYFQVVVELYFAYNSSKLEVFKSLWFQSDSFPSKIKYVHKNNIAFYGFCSPINYIEHVYTIVIYLGSLLTN